MQIGGAETLQDKSYVKFKEEYIKAVMSNRYKENHCFYNAY